MNIFSHNTVSGYTSFFYKLTSFGGPHASGDVISAAFAGMFLCCVLHEGTKGAETGVSPVPPTINESKLNCMPVDGVVIGIPVKSLTLLFLPIGAVDITFKEFGLLGFEIGTAELNITFLAGEGKENVSSSATVVGKVSALTLSPLTLFSYGGKGLMSGGLWEWSRQFKDERCDSRM